MVILASLFDNKHFHVVTLLVTAAAYHLKCRRVCTSKPKKKTGVLIIHTIPLKAKSKTVMWYDVVYHGTEMD